MIKEKPIHSHRKRLNFFVNTRDVIPKKQLNSIQIKKNKSVELTLNNLEDWENKLKNIQFEKNKFQDALNSSSFSKIHEDSFTRNSKDTHKIVPTQIIDEILFRKEIKNEHFEKQQKKTALKFNKKIDGQNIDSSYLSQKLKTVLNTKKSLNKKKLPRTNFLMQSAFNPIDLPGRTAKNMTGSRPNINSTVSKLNFETKIYDYKEIDQNSIRDETALDNSVINSKPKESKETNHLVWNKFVLYDKYISKKGDKPYLSLNTKFNISNNSTKNKFIETATVNSNNNSILVNN